MATSLEVEKYWEVLEDRALTVAQRQSATELARRGSLTGRELDDVLKTPSAHKRLSELERLGVAIREEERKCRITGKVATTWSLTGKKAVKTAESGSKVPRPSNGVLRRCLPSLRKMYLDLKADSDPTASDIRTLGQWIASAFGGNVEEAAIPDRIPPVAPPKPERIQSEYEFSEPKRNFWTGNETEAFNVDDALQNMVDALRFEEDDDSVLDCIFLHATDLMARGEWKTCDDFLEQCDVTDLSTQIIAGILDAFREESGNLLEYFEFVERVRTELLRRGETQEEVSAILGATLSGMVG